MSNNLITPAGYSKMILHASKHPTQPLSGLLIGKIVEVSKRSTLFISDVIPLSHTQVATLPHPIFEAGVRMVHSQACSQGCSVVGTYFANERFDDSDLCEMNKRMAREVAKICSSSSSSQASASSNSNSSNNNNASGSSSAKDVEVSGSSHITLLLDNALLCAEEGPASVLAVSKIYNSLNGSRLTSGSLQFSTWNRDNGVPDAPQTFEEVRQRLTAIVSGKQRALWDFEEHLESCSSRDFYNPWIQ